MSQDTIKITGDGRTMPAAARVRSDLEVRIGDNISEARARRMEVRGSDPTSIPEVTRELTMLRGALHGVEQRIAELAGELEPILDPKMVAIHLTGEEHRAEVDRPEDERFPVVTEIGRELQALSRTVSEFEAALTFIRHAVRL